VDVRAEGGDDSERKDSDLRLLLTSTGVSNGSIRGALVELLGKPIERAAAVFVPTAIYAMPSGGAYAWQGLRQVGGLGWREFALLELTTLPSIEEGHWAPPVEAADAVVVGGGITPYLSYWMQASGLAERLPGLLEDSVYVGISAGSVVMSPGLNVDRDELERTGVYNDDEYHDPAPLGAGSDRGLGLVDFAVRPHLNSGDFPDADLATMEGWAAKLDYPMYAIDDETAIKVVDGHVEVVSEGEWKLFDA
jgi:dipeptidase E